MWFRFHMKMQSGKKADKDRFVIIVCCVSFFNCLKVHIEIHTQMFVCHETTLRNSLRQSYHMAWGVT